MKKILVRVGVRKETAQAANAIRYAALDGQKGFQMKLSNIKVDYHRNGISGEGFHVATFHMQEGERHHNMVAVLFGEPGQCAVLDIDLLKENNIEFARGNSWRGDHFEGELRAAIKEAA